MTVALAFLLAFWLPLGCLILILLDLGIVIEVANHLLALPVLGVAAVLLFILLLGRRVVLLFRRPAGEEPRRSTSVRAHTITTRDHHTVFVDTLGPREEFSLLFCQGWEVTSDVWHYLKKSRRLERLGRLITWDLPGVGKSGKLTAPVSLDSLAHCLRDVIEQEGGRRIVLTGLGVGGFIALQFCRLFPDLTQRRLIGLVLIDTPMTSLGRPPALLRFAAAVSPLIVALQRLVYWSGLGHLVTALLSFGGRESRGQLDLVVRSWLSLSPRTVLAYITAFSDFNPTEALQTAPLSLLVLHSKRRTFPTLPPRDHDQSASVVAELATSSLWGPLERSVECEQQLRDWLEILPGGPGGQHTMRRRQREQARSVTPQDRTAREQT